MHVHLNNILISPCVSDPMEGEGMHVHLNNILISPCVSDPMEGDGRAYLYLKQSTMSIQRTH